MSALPLPESLQRAVEAAQEALHRDPDHWLDPPQRMAVYDGFGSYHDRIADRARAHLAIAAAKVVPLYDELRPYDQDTRIHTLVQLAEGVVTGRTPGEEAYRYVHGLVNWPDGWADFGLHPAGLMAGDSAKTAVYEVLDGGDCLEYGDPDAAYLAACAYAADLERSSHSDLAYIPAKLLEFWGWWLREAVPAAWEAAQVPPEMTAASETGRDDAPAEGEEDLDVSPEFWPEIPIRWRHVVPYEHDVRTTLQHLREHVFASGDYDKSHVYRDDEEPASLDELLRRAGARTYATIPDPAGEPVRGIPVAASGSAEDAHTIRPLSVHKLVRLFGTEKPTWRMVDAAEEGLIVNLTQPIYIVIYEDRRGWHEDDAQPEAIWFAGSSGGGP